MQVSYGLFHTGHGKPLVVREVREGAAFELRARDGREWVTNSPFVAEYIRTSGDMANGAGLSRKFPFHSYDPSLLKVIKVVSEFEDITVPPIPSVSWLDVAEFLAESTPIYRTFIEAYKNAPPETQRQYRCTTADLLNYLSKQTTIPQEVVNALA